MPLRQQRAVTGKRYRPGYDEMIWAQTPYLRPLKRLKEEEKYREKTFGLEKKRLKLKEDELREYEEQSKIREELEKQALEEQKKQARKARYISLSNLGLTAGLGLAREEFFADSPSSVIKSIGGKVAPFVKTLKTPSPYIGGAVGTLAGQAFGDDSSSKAAMIGAGAGALTSLITSGFDLYSTVIGGIMGGLGGLF
jgi:hypothetical protein